MENNTYAILYKLQSENTSRHVQTIMSKILSKLIENCQDPFMIGKYWELKHFCDIRAKYQLQQKYIDDQVDRSMLESWEIDELRKNRSPIRKITPQEANYLIFPGLEYTNEELDFLRRALKEDSAASFYFNNPIIFIRDIYE